jgi:hypothetical protein
MFAEQEAQEAQRRAADKDQRMTQACVLHCCATPAAAAAVMNLMLD